jgi:hypothetical protein
MSEDLLEELFRQVSDGGRPVAGGRRCRGGQADRRHVGVMMMW